MTHASAPHHSSAAPFWEVIAVWDPDGNGSDFAYTRGLSRAGLPELHVWARPDHGDDPGADFLLSQRDLTVLLNRWASELLDGTLAPGSERVLDLDLGASRTVFTVGVPVGPDTVDAFQLDADTRVLPLRWSIERTPIGPLLTLTAEEEAARTRRLTRLNACRVGPYAAAGFPDPVDVGPYSAAVSTAARLLAAADVRVLREIFMRALDPDLALRPEGVLGLAAARARPVGLVAATERVRALASQVTSQYTGGTVESPRWSALVDDVGPFLDAEERRRFSALLEDGARAVVAALLTVEVLGHVAGADLEAVAETWWQPLLGSIKRRR